MNSAPIFVKWASFKVFLTLHLKVIINTQSLGHRTVAPLVNDLGTNSEVVH